MTEEFQKVKPTTYPLGDGDYVTFVKTANGYHFWAEISGDHTQMEVKEESEIANKLAEYCTNQNTDHTKKAMKHEAVALRIKEGGLEKTSKDLGEKK
jgi:hypothetical protein